jgi:hypothetical protein
VEPRGDGAEGGEEEEEEEEEEREECGRERYPDVKESIPN